MTSRAIGGPCCVSGHEASGTPRGEVVSVAGTPTYVARPPSAAKPKAALVIASDVFGLGYKNNKLLADAYAQHGGFATFVPDLFAGAPLPPSYMEKLHYLSVPTQAKPSLLQRALGFGSGALTVLSMVPGILRILAFHAPGGKVPLVEAVVKELKEKEGYEAVALMGYCYGGTIALALGRDPALLAAFGLAHSGVSVPASLDPLRVPAILFGADHDFQWPAAKVEEAKQLLAQRKDHEFVVKFYPGTFHGFAVRGDERDEKVRAAKEDVFQESLRFFQRHTKG